MTLIHRIDGIVHVIIHCVICPHSPCHVRPHSLCHASSSSPFTAIRFSRSKTKPAQLKFVLTGLIRVSKNSSISELKLIRVSRNSSISELIDFKFIRQGFQKLSHLSWSSNSWFTRGWSAVKFDYISVVSSVLC